MNVVLEAGELVDISTLIVDVYYSQERRCFNNKLFFDQLYCFEYIKEEHFDAYKNHAEKVYVKEAVLIELHIIWKSSKWKRTITLRS